MGKFKQSQYNIELTSIGNEKHVYMYNTKSASIIKFEKELYNLVCNEDFENNKITDIIEKLVAQGIIVPEHKNEYNEIRFYEKVLQYNLQYNILTLIIAPTLKCNYRCVYCFEDVENAITAIMNDDTVSDIVKFVSRHIESNVNLKKVSVQWFGGEPLLCFDSVIQNLSQRLINLCESKNIRYESGIITNGYLLKENILEKLIDECRVNDFQITFDGRKSKYEQYKRPPSGAYETVKDNIMALSRFIYDSQKSARVNIRINVDKNNCADAELLYNEICQDNKYKNNFNFYLGRLRGRCGCDFLAIDEFEQCETAFNSVTNKAIKLIEPKTVWCSQYTMNSFCIGPEGELYKCEHDFGIKEKVIGDIVNGVAFNDFLLNYINMKNDIKCKDCKIYPICLGGCPNMRHEHGSDCEYTVDKIINRACDYIKSQKI